MTTITPSDVAKALDGRPSGHGYIAHCPAHEDNKSSLSIHKGDRVDVVLKCQAGCSQDEVLTQLQWQHGLSLKAEPKADDKKTIASIDDYQDWDGTLLYQKLRYEPKDFRLRQPDGVGGWQWNMKGLKEVIFRLPKLKDAIDKGQSIFIPEGEKDCKNLEQLGLIATTNTHGASKDKYKPKWNDHHAKFLTGAKEVFILPDNDESGKCHAIAVADSLVKLGIKVKLVELPNLPVKGDVSDWLAAGGTKEQLLALVASAKFYGNEATVAPSFSPRPICELMGQNFEPPRWAVDDILPEGLTILAGKPKSGKSWMALDIALAISRGDKVLGDYDTTKGEALYLALEDNGRRLRDRLNAIADEDKTRENSRLFYCTDIPGMGNGGITALESWLNEHPDCRLVIIDTLARFMPPTERGANAYQSDYAIAARLQTLAIKYQIALLLVHHLRKGKSEDINDEISGSNGLSGAADATWILKRPNNETVGVLHLRGRDVEEMKLSAEFNKETCRWSIQGDARQESRRKILVALSVRFGSDPFTYATAKEPLGVSLRHARRVIDSLLSSGHVARADEKVGKAYQFKITDKMVDSIFAGGNADAVA